MKTYFVFAKLLPAGSIHIVFKLYNVPPRNYYSIGMATGRNQGQARASLLEYAGWKPPKDYSIRRRMKL